MKSTRSRSSRTSSRLRRLTAHLPILLLVVGELFVSQPAESAYAVGSPESLAEQTHEDECDDAHAKFDSDLADFQEQWRRAKKGFEDGRGNGNMFHASWTHLMEKIVKQAHQQLQADRAAIAAACNFPHDPNYPPGEGTSAGLSSSTSSPGGTINVGGSGFLATSPIIIVFASIRVAVAFDAADPTGALSTTVVIPKDATLGDHELIVSGFNRKGFAREQSLAIEVVSVASPEKTTSRGQSTGHALPSTGVIAFPLTLAGVELMAVGVLFTLISRRRYEGK